MKKIALVFLFILLFTCDSERVIQLPEIKNAEVTEVLDVSPAYIFYEESQPDSTLFNRKNLIGTTNWLVNVDKRLMLKQAIPHLQYLQNKRRKASMHKKEDAKNYFTCNDSAIGNLGFIEFTDVYYFNTPLEESNDKDICHMHVNSLREITFSVSVDINMSLSKENFARALNSVKQEFGDKITIQLNLNSELSFQDYITLKNTLLPFKNTISNKEYIF